MPTASRLVGALVFGALAYVIAGAARATMPEGSVAPWLFQISVLLGLYHGWAVAGRNAGQGWYMGAVNGLRTAIQMTVIGVFYFATYEMFRRAVTQLSYEVGEAVMVALNLFLEYGQQILVRPVLILVIGGGIVAGILVEAAAQRWR